MLDLLLEPFTYEYMTRAIAVSAIVGGICAFLSCYLILKGWSLMGDALAHSVVPGVALAYLLALPYSIGAFFAGLLASGAMQMMKHQTKLKEDTVIGLIFTTFFAIGLLLISVNPVAVNIQNIVLGNILSISDTDIVQITVICIISAAIMALKWKDFKIIFFDERHARSIGLPVRALKITFFTCLSAMCVAALQSVGACLVIAIVITPGATAYLLTDRFGKMIILAVLFGTLTNTLGIYASFFLNAHPGGMVVCLQTLLFMGALFFAPKHGIIAQKRSTVL